MPAGNLGPPLRNAKNLVDLSSAGRTDKCAQGRAEPGEPPKRPETASPISQGAPASTSPRCWPFDAQLFGDGRIQWPDLIAVDYHAQLEVGRGGRSTISARADRRAHGGRGRGPRKNAARPRFLSRDRPPQGVLTEATETRQAMFGKRPHRNAARGPPPVFATRPCAGLPRPPPAPPWSRLRPCRSSTRSATSRPCRSSRRPAAERPDRGRGSPEVGHSTTRPRA